MKNSVLKQFLSLVKNPNFNVSFTFFVIVGCIYVTILALFDRSILDRSEIIIFKNETSTIFSSEKSNFTSVLSLFYLWICALIFGRIASYLSLPPLLGMLIAGIFFNNVHGLKGFIVINHKWEETCRQVAFLLILIRAGIGINPLILRKSFHHCFILGFGSTTFEVFAIIFSSFYLFNVPLAVGISFGFVLTATSPAITVPTMIKLQKERHGAKRGVPTIVLASATMDNLFCISAFYITVAITFLSKNKSLWSTLTSVSGEMIASIILGITAGFILQYFPHIESGFLHFSRGTLILLMSLAVYYGTRNLGYFVIGPIVVFLMSIMATMKWKYDNADHTRIEERGFKILWIFLFLPLLFSLIGLLFDFSRINWQMFQISIALISIGIFARIFIVFFILIFTHFNIKEKLFMSICFSPKATVQAALAPTLAAYCLKFTEYESYADLFLQTCILSILITAPISQILILMIGRAFLQKHDASETNHVNSKIFPSPIQKTNH